MLTPGLNKNHVIQPDSSPNRVKNLPGYTTPVFKGKAEQRARVEAHIASTVFFCFLYLF